MADRFDAVVVGGGIAGASVAYQLSFDRTVVLVEQEPQLAVHSTGRSAATVIETLASAPVRELTIRGRAFLENPPDVFEGSPLAAMGLLYFGGDDDHAALEGMFADFRELVPDVELVTELPAVLRPERVTLGLFEPRAMAIDVHMLHQGFVRGLRRNGGEIRTRTRLSEVKRVGAQWRIGDVETPLLVDAAGAWGDVVAAAAGAGSVGLQPLRRSAFMLPAGPDLSAGLPMLVEVNDRFYLKPESGGFLGSPVDEQPQPPGDTKPDELEIAQALDYIGELTVLDTRHISSPWGGLRTFAPDRLPVLGFDPHVEGFFFYVGQGGYGVQTAPALSALAAAIIRGEADAPEFSPSRFAGEGVP